MGGLKNGESVGIQVIVVSAKLNMGLGRVWTPCSGNGRWTSRVRRGEEKTKGIFGFTARI